MRLVIDMQGAQTESRFRGIGQYSTSFARAVCENKGKHEVILVLNGMLSEAVEAIRRDFSDLLPQENIRVWFSPLPFSEADAAHQDRRLVAQTIREAFILSLAPDVVHITSLFEGYVDDSTTSLGVLSSSNIFLTITLYDLIPLLNKGQYLSGDRRYEDFYLRKTEELKKANRLFAISLSARNEALANLNCAPEMIVNVSAAANQKFKPIKISSIERREFLDSLNISKPFVFYTGGADERKNLSRLVDAYAALPDSVRRAHQLVFAGKMPIEEIKMIGRRAKLDEDEFIVLGYVNEDILVHLYNLCKIFVFPSWHEGFGLPCLEAMACGAAVIGANTTSLPEVIGLEQALFDPFQVHSISNVILRSLTDYTFQDELKRNAGIRSQLFDWKLTAQRAIDEWEKGVQAQQTRESKFSDWIPYDQLNSLLADGHETNLFQLAEMLANVGEVKGPTRNLFLDVSELVKADAKTGIQRVVRSILNEFLINPPEGHNVSLVYGSVDFPGYRYANNFKSRFTYALEGDDSLIDFNPGDLFIGLDFQPWIAVKNREFFQKMRICGVSVIFVVYDLLPVKYPQYFFPGAYDVFSKWLSVVFENHGAACISNVVKTELVQWAGEKAHNKTIKTFQLGFDIRSSLPTMGLSNDAKAFLNVIKSKITILMVGTLEPRKGYDQALSAFEKLWSCNIDVNLVIVGKTGWSVDALVERIVSHFEYRSRLFWLEGISDEYLEKIYEASSCLLAASFGEGFGLPLVEAADKNLPIVARRLEVFCEVLGNGAFFFEAQTSDELAEALMDWIELFSVGKHPKPEKVKKVAWCDSARQLLDICKSVGKD